MKLIWIIDNDKSIRCIFEKALARANMEYKTFSTIVEAMKALESEKPQVVVCDIRLPNGSGFDFLSEMKRRYTDIPVIIMSAHSDLDSVVAAFQGGAFEYLAKPFDVEQAIEVIKSAIDKDTKQALEKIIADETPEIIGQSPAMQEVFRTIGRLSRSHATVLINGESGSGKELVASALHRHSPRGDKPFIAINTAAIPKDLLESELFGHERGAFTGAVSSRRGRFEQADTGTLFLDEIGDMPADMQTRLLRVLSDGQFYRVGGHQPIKVNVRIIAATHQNLEERVKKGLFREDLFHRLNVFRLRLPALSERREDIPLLIKHFLQHSAEELGVETKQPSDAALKYLSALNWSGNVRQLENVCHWLTVMTPGNNIDISNLPQELTEDVKKPKAALRWQEALANEVADVFNRGEQNVLETHAQLFERILIIKALEYTNGRRIEAANQLGMGRNTITRKIHELGI